jgi:DNA polymerase-3 subunit gamma/tau
LPLGWQAARHAGDSRPNDNESAEAEPSGEPELPVEDEPGAGAPGHRFGSWEEALTAYADVRPGMAAMLEQVRLIEFGDRVRLALDGYQERAIAAPERMAFAEWLGREVFWEPLGEEAGESLTARREREAAAYRRRLEENALNDPHVRAVMETLDARLERVHAPGASGDESVREDVT